eukprot:UN13808
MNIHHSFAPRIFLFITVKKKVKKKRKTARLKSEKPLFLLFFQKLLYKLEYHYAS